MIKKVLLTVFLVLVQTVVFAVTKTYIGPNNGVWNTAANWSPIGVPSSSDDVIIPTGNTVTVNVNAQAKSIVVVGNLTLATTYTLIVYGDFTVTAATTGPNVPEGNFKIVENGNSTTTLIVLGNYINNGKTDFDKGDVIIVGNLITPETSTLQNLGNVIVGGDIIGDFNLQGSIQTKQQIYAVNPNATVTITPDNIDKDVVPGTPVTTPTESSALVDLVNLYIYGGNCTFTVNNIANVSACSGSNTVFKVTTNASSPEYQWQVKTSVSGWSDLTNGSLYSGVTTLELTIIGVDVTMSGYQYRAKVKSSSPSSCTKNGNYGILTVSAGPAKPMASAITQPNCKTLTGSVDLSGLPSGNWIINPGGIIGSTTTTTISGLAAGTYNFTVTNASGCKSSYTDPVDIIAFVPVTKTWNGSSWSPSSPTKDDNIVFNGVFISQGDIEACSCLVNNLPDNLGDVIINSGHTLKLTNGLTVATTTLPSGEVIAGSMAFLDGASLVQINNVANSGDIDYQRITAARKTDYTYWSSPVTPMSLGELYYPTGGTFYSYEATDAGEDWSSFDAGADMVAGKGYIANQGAAVPSGMPPPPGLLDVTFTGVPNNGSYPISVFKDKSCLLGNPYPSAIDANTFLNENTGVLFGTLYFWTHNTAIQDASNITDGSAGSGAFAYTSNDYAIYNATGGTAANQPDKDALGNSYPSTVPTGNIAAGQGFFATAKTTGTVIFNNTTRVTGNNSQFFKTKNPNKSAKTIEKNRIWLNLTNTQGAFKQTLVGYITDATNDYDDRFDGESFDGNEFVDFYSVNQDKNLVIQGRALPFDENDEVPLGFRTTINGAFTIKIDQVDGFLTNQAVFIEDKLTNTVFDLKSGNYTFNTAEGTFNDRFVLRYTNTNKTLGTSNFDSLEKSVLVSNKNKQIKIDSSVERIDKVTVFDLLGRQIYQKANVNSTELSISNLVSNRQVLMIKTTLQNGKTVTKKIIY